MVPSPLSSLNQVPPASVTVITTVSKSTDNLLTGNQTAGESPLIFQLCIGYITNWRTLTVQTGLQSRSVETGGFHIDQFLRPPNLQISWYRPHSR